MATTPRAETTGERTPISLDAASLYINRELSWLAFNERVLAQAADDRNPLLAADGTYSVVSDKDEPIDAQQLLLTRHVTEYTHE
jgi:hypothetical protein